ncbi:hypothetical protein ABBQ38_005401 [Trebouxia sp. C0009 RCD-2024]
MPFIGAVEYALWRTVDAMGHHMEACKHDPNERAAHSADQNATARTAEQEELALKLAGLLMPALRSCVKGSGRRAVICCKVLAGLMPSSKASLLCKKSLLSCSKRVDRTLDLLASVRGVQRCSNMLCPVFDYSQEQHDPSVSIAAQAYKIEWILDSGCWAPFGFMTCVAKLLDNMLKRKRLWRQSCEGLFHAKAPCYKGAPSDQYAFLPAEPIWPTPGPTAWQDIQAVVLKRRQGVASSMGAGNARTVKQALSGVGLQDCTNLPRTGTQQQVESQSQHIQAKVTRRFWLGNRYESQRWPVKTRGLSITEVKNMTGTVTC